MNLNNLGLGAITLALIDTQAGSIFGPIVPGTTGKLGNATIISDNAIGVTYQAVLPESNTTGFRGYMIGTSVTNGAGVVFNTNFYGFDEEAAIGPFCLLQLPFSFNSHQE